jgi:hypothetical protein
MSDIPWQCHVYFIVPHPTQSAILMQPGDSGWTLPHLLRSERIWPPMVAPIFQALRDTLALDAAILRCAYSQRDTDTNSQDVIYVLDSSTTDPLAGMQWIAQESIEDLPLATAKHREIIDQYFAEKANKPALRVAWAEPGWFAQAVAWCRSHLGDDQLPIEQIKIWGISCLLKMRPPQGDVYFKVSAAWDLSANEATLMDSLAALYPDHIPAPIAIDQERRWMLLSDFGKPLRGNNDPRVWERSLRAFAQIQIDSVDRVDELLRLGCLDRRLEILALQIEPLLADTPIVTGIEAAELEQVQRLVPTLKMLCTQLAAYRVPQTLVHGDFHPGNIAGESCLFFDWTDGCISHPFMDLTTVFEEARTSSMSAEALNQLRDQYLDVWTRYEPLDRLIEACAVAETLGCLHQAVSYRSIINNLEPGLRHEFSGAVGQWLIAMLHTDALKGYL